MKLGNYNPAEEMSVRLPQVALFKKYYGQFLHQHVNGLFV